MTLSPFKLPFLATYMLVGAVVGVLVIRPLNLVVIWWELSRFSDTAPGLLEFLSARQLDVREALNYARSRWT